MKRLIFTLFISLSVSSFSQTLSTHQKVISGLNNYMEFIHQSTHCLYLMQADLENFNGDLLHKIKYPKSILTFEKRDYLNNHRYYFLTPHEVYDICISSNFPITNEEKELLDKKLYRLKFLIEMLDINIGFIDIYVNDSVFATDSAYSKAFSYLNASTIYFDNIITDWKIMKDLIEQIAARYEVVDMQNPYIRTAKVLDSLFDVVYSITEASLLNDTNYIKELLPQLEYQINKLDGKEEFYLDGAQSYGRSNGKDPFNKYDNIIFDAKAELSHTKNFLKPTKYPSNLEKAYGKPYYYYNKKFINKFNRHGVGMADEFNDFADNSFDYILKKAQIPHSFMVLFPPEPEPIIANNNIQTDTTKKYDLTDAPANNIVFLLDISTSMNHPSKLPLLKDAMKFLISLMRDYDYITIVTYSGSAEIIVENISASDTSTLNIAINNLKSGGTTKLLPGIKQAYKSANKHFIQDGNNKIILATDGALDITSKMKNLAKKNSDNISLSVFYFNQQNYNFDKLEELSNLGNGNCLKINRDNIKTAIVNEAKGD